MAVFDAIICKHFSVHMKKHCFLILHGMLLTHALWNETFYTLRCPAPLRLIQCKLNRNRFMIAEVIDKSLGARFLWPNVYILSQLNAERNAMRFDHPLKQSGSGQTQQGNIRRDEWWSTEGARTPPQQEWSPEVAFSVVLLNCID